MLLSRTEQLRNANINIITTIGKIIPVNQITRKLYIHIYMHTPTIVLKIIWRNYSADHRIYIIIVNFCYEMTKHGVYV